MRMRLARLGGLPSADFGAGQAGLIAHLQQYASPEMKGELAKVAAFASFDYDWSLNDAT